MLRLFITSRFALLAVASLALPGCSGKTPAPDNTPKTETTADATSGAYKVNFRVDPNPPVGAKENNIHVNIEDSGGKPVSDAQVHVTVTMPAMPEKKMPEMKNAADLPWTGSDYSAPLQFSMAGGWNLEVEAKRGNEVLTTYKTHLEAK